MSKKTTSLGDELASLAIAAPAEFDPEEMDAYGHSDGSESDGSSNDEATAHYVPVGYETLLDASCE
jgi:hypothetical protein